MNLLSNCRNQYFIKIFFGKLTFEFFTLIITKTLEINYQSSYISYINIHLP